ncbi:hypothetical protein [Mycolicibacterium vinylchloridicum]|uniref:hypothetical protein n=1 Tax=Mycolicibacterium vinylchloridicum TaxID=2736928 RepID=UPI0015CA04B8|nr:hypothetical protein [Mycolicibacterium vinylchloridicum]
MNFAPSDTAVVVIDPQNDVLSPSGNNSADLRDATAGPRHPTRGDGYQAALVNFAFLAHAVLSTDEVIAAMEVPTGGPM